MENEELNLGTDALEIWATQEEDDLYTLCVGWIELSLSKAQAQEIIETLQGIISEKGIVHKGERYPANEGLNPRMPAYL
jgi:hypothetical protein